VPHAAEMEASRGGEERKEVAGKKKGFLCNHWQ
jgi:hypothetical protein